jgi:hypothetical protein
MRTAFLVSAMSAAALLLAGSAGAQSRYLVTVNPVRPAKGFDRISVSKAALGASRILVWANGEINPDCSEHQPGATLNLVRAPEHGRLEVVREDDYLPYPPANPRAVCNHRKVPVNHAYYAASAGYRGRDRVVLQGSSDEGRVRQITVNIDVR